MTRKQSGSIRTWRTGSTCVAIPHRPAQARPGPASSGSRTFLIAAPTGSGKTLAAFLAAIDGRVRRKGLKLASRTRRRSSCLADQACPNDIQRNLEGAMRESARRLPRARLPDHVEQELGSDRRTPLRTPAHAPSSAEHRSDHPHRSLHLLGSSPAALCYKEHEHRNRRRNSADAPNKARDAPFGCRLERARRPVWPSLAAHRLSGHPKARSRQSRASCSATRRHKARCGMRDQSIMPSSRARPCARGPILALESRDVGEVGNESYDAWSSDHRTSHPTLISQYAPAD